MRDFNAKLNITIINNIKTYFEIKLTTFIDTLTINFPIKRIDFQII